MHKLFVAMLWTSVNALFIWLLLREGFTMHPAAVVVAAAAFNVFIGMRIGYQSAEAYVHGVARTNRCLAEQNIELVHCNRELLERINAMPEDVFAAHDQGRQARMQA